MQVIKELSELKKWRSTFYNTTIALVPTMGFLHEGHLSLIKIAKDKADFVACSIFVNPTQFNEESDLENYPIDLLGDLEKLKNIGCDLVFCPNKEDIYSKNFSSKTLVEDLSLKLEGAHRPGHFDGVTTIVSILFNLFQPNFAIFGEKDFQQLRIIEKMVEDLHFPIQILRGKTVREQSGLALSSRNSRLSEKAKQIASEALRMMNHIKDAYSRGESDRKNLLKVGLNFFKKLKDIKLEYIEIVNEKSLDTEEKISANSRILCAFWIEGVRLIDNLELKENSKLICSDKVNC